MSQQLLHDMNLAWNSSAPGMLEVAVDNETFTAPGEGSNRLIAPTGALNETANFAPSAPLDLSAYDELRFWIRANQPADGSRLRPFYLEFSYTDNGDNPGEEHRWFVPVNRSDRWEHRRIGIESDRRSAVNNLQFRCLTGLPFVCHIDELLAVREEMLFDLEQTLVTRLEAQVELADLTDILLSNTANPGDTQVILPFTPGFHAGNRVLLQGGGGPEETHLLTQVTDDPNAGTTTLALDPANPIVSVQPNGVASVSLIVPVVVETPPTPTANPSPAVIMTHLDAREDLERTNHVTQRDSFRPQGSVTVCSTRPSPRAYLVEYQIIAVAPERVQQLTLHTQLLQQLATDVPLRINGIPSPLSILPPPVLSEERQLGILSPIFVRIGTRLEIAPRQQRTWVQQGQIEAGHIDAPEDREGIVIQL